MVMSYDTSMSNFFQKMSDFKFLKWCKNAENHKTNHISCIFLRYKLQIKTRLFRMNQFMHI
jgi:hypothetical protein